MALGPLEYLVVGFEGNRFHGQILSELRTAKEKGIIRVVDLLVLTKDDQGNFVTNLTKDDFRIFEDDRPQDVQIFEKQEKVESAIGILMDTSGSMVDILPLMRRGIRDFTRALPKADEFFLVSFGTAVKLQHTS